MNDKIQLLGVDADKAVGQCVSLNSDGLIELAVISGYQQNPRTKHPFETTLGGCYCSDGIDHVYHENRISHFVSIPNPMDREPPESVKAVNLITTKNNFKDTLVRIEGGDWYSIASQETIDWNNNVFLSWTPVMGMYK